MLIVLSNATLSEQRADSVGQYLVGRGIKADRIQIVGYSAYLPMASISACAGRVRNRGIELELLPL